MLSFNSYALSIVNLTSTRVVYIDVPVYICGDDLAPRNITNSDKSDESGVIESDESRAIEYVEKAVFIRLTPDDPRCIEAEKSDWEDDGELIIDYFPVYVEIPIEFSILKCGGVEVDIIEANPQTRIITEESLYMEKYIFIEKNLEPNNPTCIEAENSKTNVFSSVRNGYGEIVERYNYKTPKYGSFVTVTEVSDDGITEISYLDKDLYIKHGKDIYWWRVGQKGVEKNYDNNVLNGKYTSWYDNGQIMGEGNYKDGKIVGKYTFWHRNGQIDSERTY